LQWGGEPENSVNLIFFAMMGFAVRVSQEGHI
jgi:hypothetical protein